MKSNFIASWFKTMLVLALFLLPVGGLMAQEGFDDDVDDETPQAFIDGLVGVGLVAGAVYGYNKLRNKE